MSSVDARSTCDYQSERHCSKTTNDVFTRAKGAITSQNGTAPKLDITAIVRNICAITSQNGTAPKRRLGFRP